MDNKTAIIGVNESGKSNILEAIGKLEFLNKLSNYYNSIKNLSVPDEEVQILVQLELKESEMEELCISEDTEKTLLTFRAGRLTTISGTLSHAIAQNEIVKQATEFWDSHTFSDFYNITNDNRNSYSNAVQLIKKCSEEIIPLNQLDILTKNLKKDMENKECVECVKSLKAKLLKIYSMFPIVMYKQ